MSNILIIKHGSLGDLIQANGAIKDIKNAHSQSKVLLLTGNKGSGKSTLINHLLFSIFDEKNYDKSKNSCNWFWGKRA